MMSIIDMESENQELPPEGWSHKEWEGVQETRARKQVSHDYFFADRKVLSGDGVKEFFGTVIDFLKTGKRVDRPKIVGGVGEELQVSVAGCNLQELLPSDDYGFLGVTVTPPIDRLLPLPSESSSPGFNPLTKRIELVVDIERGASGRKTESLPNSSLAVLHEIGHARAEEKQHFSIQTHKVELLARHFPGRPSDIDWDIKGYFEYLAGGGEVKIDLVLDKIRERVAKRFDRGVEDGEEENLTAKLFRAWGEDLPGFRRDLIDKITGDLEPIFREAVRIASEGGARRAADFLEEKLAQEGKRYSKEVNKLEKEMTVLSERQAWAEALIMARRLIRKNGAKLWRGKLNGLFFEIDRLINAHGIAGRMGVRTPRSREKLFLPRKGEEGYRIVREQARAY